MYDYEIEHNALVRRAAAECAVLLRSNGTFPLAGTGDLALYGSGARCTISGGTGSGEVNTRFSVSIEQGLEEAGFHITTKPWLDDYDRARAEAAKAFRKVIQARAHAKHTIAALEGMGAVMPEPEYKLPLMGAGDTAVYVVGRISGEGSDREPVAGDILLTKTEVRDILTLQRQYPKFLLVLNVGGVVDLTPLGEVENILLLSQLGAQTGTVLADLILGKSYPSGRLASTWAAWDKYSTIGTFGERDDTRYKEGVYVGYRYFDTTDTPVLFPFGYGLNYTSFALSDASVSLEGEDVSVSVQVTNMGARPGKETVQIYVSVPAGKLDQPYQTLAGWAKSGELQPGELETVTVRFKLSELASYDTDNARYILEPGSYVVRMGVNSQDTRPLAALRLEEEISVLQAKNCCGSPDFEDWKPETPRAVVIPADLPVFPVQPGDIPSCTVSFDREEEIDARTDMLSDEELCSLGIGAFDPNAGVLSIIGNASSSVAGAAGETTSLLKAKGIPNLVMADGPAGLRLSRLSYRDEKGAHSLGNSMPESIASLLPAPVRLLTKLMGGKAPKDAQMVEQYATAIPIGTAIAQSWNPALAEELGDAVGDEMERFGVHLWLAPALNIHRSIRCGRNFEYYSEDPLISGKFAAAIARGVQRHPGRGVTIKHFCVNNQETNRMQNNSQVSERALREIYLKGFGICVREGKPQTVMTSYNLLNGTHTSENRELLQDILRCEFGFEGVVMTDWVIAMATSKAAAYPNAVSDNVALAGGDLFMPGSKADYDRLLQAVQSGKVPRWQLKENAARVSRLAELDAGQH